MVDAGERLQPSFRDVWIFPFGEKGKALSLRSGAVRRSRCGGTAVQYYIGAGEWVGFSLRGDWKNSLATVAVGAAG